MKYNLVINQNHNYEGKQHDYLDVGVLRRFSPVLFQMLPQNDKIALVWLFFTVYYHMCPLSVCPEWWFSLSLLSLVIAVMTTQASQSSQQWWWWSFVHSWEKSLLSKDALSKIKLSKNTLAKIHFLKSTLRKQWRWWSFIHSWEESEIITVPDSLNPLALGYQDYYSDDDDDVVGLIVVVIVNDICYSSWCCQCYWWKLRRE